MMKKNLLLGFGIVALASAAFGILSNESKTISSVKAEDNSTLVTYIPFNNDNFTIVTDEGVETELGDTSDWVTGRYGTFWNYRYFNAMDDFYDGNRQESWTGTITSRTWVQQNKYVTFTLGGNSQNKVLIKNESGEVVATANNNQFNDPYLSVNMITKVVTVPEEYIGQTLHLEIIDSTTNGFGMTTFGALKVNQTLDDVAQTVVAHIAETKWIVDLNDDSAPANTNTLAADYIINVYRTADEYELVRNNGLIINEDGSFTSPLTDVDEGFESSGLTNWAYDIEYSDNGNEEEPANYFIPFASSISEETYAGWIEHMPFNKTGNKFYKGWEDGFVEAAKYRLLSAPFTLSGTGLISIKMAGNSAALQILDASTHKQLMEVNNQAFLDNVDTVVGGGRLCTMVRHIIDASDYLGQQIVIALADNRTGGGWGCVFFDELITNYQALPSLKLDTIVQSGTINGEDVTNYGVIRDTYVGSMDSTFGQAYTFMNNYYDTLRNSTNNFSYCSIISSEEVKNVLESYEALPEEVQTIVQNSDDYSYTGSIYSSEVQLYKVIETINYINGQNDNAGNLKSSFGVLPVKNSIAIAIGVLSLTVFLFAVIFVSRKKKTHN